MGMPYAHYLTLRDRLGEVVDVTREFQRLRLVKSNEELEWLRRAAELSDKAMVAVAEGARPDMTEVELVALAEQAYRAEGGMPHITFLRSMAMDNPTGCLPAQNPSSRPLQLGDVIITEFSASYWGYSGQLHRPIFVDAEPAPDWQHLFDAALAAYQGLVEAIRAGAAVADAIRDAGFTIYDDLLHGYGVDILPPLIDRERFEDPTAAEGSRFERNMAVVLQPNPITPDERKGLQLGALTIVTDAGAEWLHRVPLEPLVAA
jgi:Xaa-Pro aminopeptidase